MAKHSAKKPAVRQDITVGEALRAVARDIIAEARAALENRSEPDAVAVHDYRKAMKRWRALLRLLEPFLGEDGRQLRLEARDQARALTGARDAQSAIDALKDLKDHELNLSARSMDTIRTRLEGLRESAEASTLTPEARTELSAALDKATTAILGWRLEAIGFSELARALADNYRRVRKERPDEWDSADAEALHDLRQRVVVHRYQMELVEPLWPKLGRVWVAEAQRLRDRLGAHQDLAVLRALTAPHQPLAHWRSQLTPLIAERQAAHVKAAQRIAGRLLAERPKGFRDRLEALWESGLA
jgi:CHAD domain-containing protein